MDRVSDVSAALFRSLAHDLGFDSGDITGTRFDPFPSGLPAESELGPADYARHALLASAFKKSEVESSHGAELATFADFRTAQAQCETQSVEALRSWDGSPAVGYSVATARDLLYSWLFKEGQPTITMSSIEAAARFGPGSSVGLGGRPPSLYFKIGGAKLTAGSEFVRSWYKASVSNVPLCEAAEMARKAAYGEIEVVDCGNLTFVPKSYSRRRIVVTEPTLNTYFQLGLGAELERVLRAKTGIDFSSQPARNSELARLGSEYGTYATMDLKQCSDYISMALIEFMFPPTLVRWIDLLRTKKVRYAVNTNKIVDGVMQSETHRGNLEVYSFATMGNGFCFPIQTMLLSALVLGVYDTLGIRPGANWGVFGDDIVVATEAYALLAQTLQELGLVVNLDKSFSSGKFRESCGTDWFSGVNVRGVYLKRYASDQDLFASFNLLNMWSSRTGISLLETLKTILSFVEGPIPIVPPDEGLSAGIHSPEPLTWHTEDCETSLDHWEYYPYIPVPSALNLEPWEEYAEFGAPLFDRDQGKRRKQFQRWLSALQSYCGGFVNEPAALKVLLAGGLRRSKLTFRTEKAVKYRQIVRRTPRWGYTELDEYRKIGVRKHSLMTQNVVRALAEFLTEAVRG